jgi:hypothetical protein
MKSRRTDRFMTPKIFVRREHPQAYCEQIGERFQILTPLQHGRVLILGEAGSCKTAWAEALKNSKRSNDL